MNEHDPGYGNHPARSVPETISDKEFISEIRRGLICIMRALMRKYCLSWLDFFPKDTIVFREVPAVVDVTERAI